MNILIVKLSSLGDVVHAMPAVMDLRHEFPHARIDWVVERSFAPLVSLSQAVHRVIEVDLREWRHAPFAASTRQAWRAFKDQLQLTPYDAIIDLQGLTKSAWVAWLAQRSQHGKRYAMANQTEGSGYEAPTRWVADVAVDLPVHIHAVDRARWLCAKALGYAVPTELQFGLKVAVQATRPQVVLVHGTSRQDKQWSESSWIELAQRLHGQGLQVVLPSGHALEHERSVRLAQSMPNAQVWPVMNIQAVTHEMARCVGVIGVDSGLSHIAVALRLPHVQIYNFDTAWRTGPLGLDQQCSVVAQPQPLVDEVWQAWLKVRA